MMIARLQQSTRVLGKSQGYLGLPVRDVIYPDGTPVMQTCWTPTPDELEKLAKGANIIVELLGNIQDVDGRSHPPIKLSVGEFPE